MPEVLVTGGSGFVGSHCLLALLDAGYDVRTTVRSLGRETAVRDMLRLGGAEPGGRLRFLEADLERDAGWREAVTGCDFVLHVASPFPAGNPANEDDLVRPAREGTLRVLRAARDAGVRRVVLTSSFAAVSYCDPPPGGVFTEANWTDLDTVRDQPYPKSKTLAERAAWEFMAHEGGGMELAAVNPTGIFGPALGSDLSTSVHLVRMMLNRAMPAAPRIHFGVVDVRDVAALHLLAMTRPEAQGERFIAVAGPPLSILDIANLLRARMGKAARGVPKHEAPDWLVRVIALFSPSAGAALPQLGLVRAASSRKAEQLLGWQPRSSEDAILASAHSLVQLKLVGKS